MGKLRTWKDHPNNLGSKSWEKNLGYRMETRKGFLIDNFAEFRFPSIPFSFSVCCPYLPFPREVCVPSFSIQYFTLFLFLYPIQNTSFHVPDHPNLILHTSEVLCIMILCAQPQLCFAFCIVLTDHLCMTTIYKCYTDFILYWRSH